MHPLFHLPAFALCIMTTIFVLPDIWREVRHNIRIGAHYRALAHAMIAAGLLNAVLIEATSLALWAWTAVGAR